MNPNYKEILKQITSYKLQGGRVLIAGLLIQMIIGIFFAWPIIYSYHMILIQHQYSDWQFMQYMCYPMMIFMMNLCLPFSDRVIRYFGPKYSVLLLSCLIQLTLSLIAILYNSIWLHMILLIFVMSPAVGLLYSIPFMCCQRYFVKQKMYLNSIFQLFIGIGAVIALYIFESNLSNQLETYYDNNELHCGECFNFQMRQQFRTLGIWVLFLGIMATILNRMPDGEVAESIVDYDLLAFSHLDIVQPAQNAIATDIFDKDETTLVQKLSSNQFKTLAIITLSSSFLPYMLFTQYQSMQSIFNISYESTVYSFRFTIILYGLIRTLFTYIIGNLQYEQAMQRYCGLMVSLISVFLIGLYFNNQILLMISINGLVITLSILMALHATYIPKIFGAISAQKIFSITLILMGCACLLSSIVSYSILNNLDDNMEHIKIALLVIGIKVIIGMILSVRQLRQ